MELPSRWSVYVFCRNAPVSDTQPTTVTVEDGNGLGFTHTGNSS